MTNGEKYLKNPDDYHDLACEIAIYMSNSIKKGTVQNIDDFFKKQVKPTLSEDEKVILKNVDNKYATIGRDEDGLFIAYYFDECENDCNYLPFNNLFEFINLGEEYEISDLLGDEDNG